LKWIYPELTWDELLMTSGPFFLSLGTFGSFRPILVLDWSAVCAPDRVAVAPQLYTKNIQHAVKTLCALEKVEANPTVEPGLCIWLMAHKKIVTGSSRKEIINTTTRYY